MDSKFKYDPDGIIQLAANIANHKGQMSNIIMELKKYVEQLQDDWKSDTSVAFVERYNELYKRVDAVIESIGNTEESLVCIAKYVQNQEKDILN